jgi:hypothetical protein
MGSANARRDASDAATHAARPRSPGARQPALRDAGAAAPLPVHAGNAAVARLIQRRREEEQGNPAPGGRVLQRTITINLAGKKALKIANLVAFKKNKKLYAELVESLIKPPYDAKAVEYHLGQLLSGEWEFENERHFQEALAYDLANKSVGDHPLTLQEQYMTLIGWNRRAKAPAPTGLTGADKGAKKGGKPPVKPGKPTAATGPGGAMKVYRTMKTVDWEALKKDPTRLTGHLGDFKQAHNYLHRKSAEPKVLVEFTLQAGAEKRLFSTAVMAFPIGSAKRKVPNLIRDTLVKEGASDSFALASTNEGKARDRVGVKSERGEAGFSFSIGGGTSSSVFMSLVESKEDIMRSEGDSAAPSLDVLMASEDKDVEDPSAPGKDESADEASGSGSGAELSAAELELQTRLAAFLEALAAVDPVIAPEDARGDAADAANQYVEDEGGKDQSSSPAPKDDKGKGKVPSVIAKPKRFARAELTVIHNPGGGECLFHALIGRDLGIDELLVLRQQVAALRGGMPENRVLNAINVAEALSQTYGGEYDDRIDGRTEIPNDVYALLQAVPGIYAGDDELEQWCRLTNRKVAVLDSTAAPDSGALRVFSAQGRRIVRVTGANMYDRARDMARRGMLVLYKTPVHWERVTAVNG